MTYPLLNATNSGDLTSLMVYANSITAQLFVPSLIFSFFFIVLIGVAISQQRFSNNIRPEQVFASASFATFGLATLFMMRSGLLGIRTYLFIIGITILSVVWLYFSDSGN